MIFEESEALLIFTLFCYRRAQCTFDSFAAESVLRCFHRKQQRLIYRTPLFIISMSGLSLRAPSYGKTYLHEKRLQLCFSHVLYMYI